MPANAQLFFATVMTIAAFDLYEIGDDTNYILDLEPIEPVNENFNKLGFETKYFINNMGTLMIWPLFYACQAVYYAVVTKLGEWCQKRRLRAHGALGKKQLYFSSLITLIRESFSIILLCGLIAVPIISFKTYGQTVQSLFAIFFLLLIILWPIYLYWTLSKKINKLSKMEYREKYGNAYLHLRLSAGKSVFIWPSFFYIRRFLFSIAVLVFYQTVSF